MADLPEALQKAVKEAHDHALVWGVNIMVGLAVAAIGLVWGLIALVVHLWPVLKWPTLVVIAGLLISACSVWIGRSSDPERGALKNDRPASL